MSFVRHAEWKDCASWRHQQVVRWVDSKYPVITEPSGRPGPPTSCPPRRTFTWGTLFSKTKELINWLSELKHNCLGSRGANKEMQKYWGLLFHTCYKQRCFCIGFKLQFHRIIRKSWIICLYAHRWNQILAKLRLELLCKIHILTQRKNNPQDV